MYSNDLSGCGLIGLSSSLAILVSESLTSEELATSSAFFTSFADNLALLAIAKAKEEPLSPSNDNLSI